MDEPSRRGPATRPARASRIRLERVLVLAALGLMACIAYRAWADEELAGGDLHHPTEWLDRNERLLKLELCLACAALVLWPERRRDEDRDATSARRAPPRLTIAAALAMGAYYNFGAFRAGYWLHSWELFHYALGSKYFPELGYDGLYAASARAQLTTAGEPPLQKRLRDLRTNEIVESTSLEPHFAEVAARFRPERWEEFRSDHVLLAPPPGAERIRLDHGYNPTPAWTFVARLLVARVPFTVWALFCFSLIDQLLLAVMWVVLFRTYGSRLGCLAMTVFGLSFPSRFFWNGGALLRFDWLVAVVIGVCLLKRGRPGWAGTAFAYATMVRIFPVLFLFGPAVLALRALIRKEETRWVTRFARGFALTCGIGLAAGCFAGRGAAAWPESVQNLRKHNSSWLTNNVGLTNLFVYDQRTYRRQLRNPALADPWRPWERRMTELTHERRLPILIASLALLGLLAAAAWRSPRDEAAVLGVGVAFTLLLLTCYYWAMLLLVPIRGRERAAGAVLLLNALLFELSWRESAFSLIFGVMSWALVPLLVLWVMPDVMRTLRPRGRATGAPS